MQNKSLTILLSLFVLILGETACDKAPTTATSSPANESIGRQSSATDSGSQKNIVQVASGSQDHTTLVAAVKAAELVDVLSNPGPFTVFAPTNEAFAKLAKGTVENLLKPENKKALQNILQYHVSLGVFKLANLHDGQILGEVNGDTVKIAVKDGKTQVNGANIIASIPTSNGIIHVVDAVLLPPTGP